MAIVGVVQSSDLIQAHDEQGKVHFVVTLRSGIEDGVLGDTRSTSSIWQGGWVMMSNEKVFR